VTWSTGWRSSWRLPQRIPLRLRVLFRGAFLLLALATVALAFTVLQQEKEQGWRSYQDGFRKNQAQIVARLRHPTGQLALLNPAARGSAVTPLRPLLLPFSAIDFDDRAKAQQAVEMAGCQVRYPPPGGATERDATLCVAVGNNPLAGGFIYAVGSFASGELVARVSGEKDLSLAHRAHVTVAMRGQTFRWVAPFEAAPDTLAAGPGARGRLTGFAEEADGSTAIRPQRDFRGWLWQDGRCLDATAANAETCERRAFFSIRLPIELFRDELLLRPRPAWPPADLDRIEVRVQMLPPGTGAAALFDSNRAGATPPFSLADLAPLLLPGESLRIRRVGDDSSAPDLIALKGAEDATQTSSPWLNRLIRQLPVDGYDQPIEAREALTTSLGSYELILAGDLRGVNRGLAVVATRLSWFVGAMLAAIALTWLVIELSVIRRITLLTRRAAAVGRGVKAATSSANAALLPLDVADLRGSDELGLLAGVLGDLLQRVNDDVRREQIRVAQEKDQWHAVGHEIMSPLQSLLALHAAPDDPSRRYLGRMQQALRVLYGTASPSEAFESATLAVQAIDVNAFLQHVARNAPEAGIADVEFSAAGRPVWVRADEYSLEDVVLHVLRNAERHRVAGTPIRITLDESETAVRVALHNVGDPIGGEMLARIFEYGVSDQPDAGALGSRGQGLFVARTYMAKMGGTIAAQNEADGVCFVLSLQRAAP
jgi:signal transduction histidine kinase